MRPAAWQGADAGPLLDTPPASLDLDGASAAWLLAILVVLAALVLAVCLQRFGLCRGRARSKLMGRVCILHAEDEESTRVAREVAAGLRALGGSVSDTGQVVEEAYGGVADLTLCFLTPTIFASQRVRQQLAVACESAAAVIPVHSGDCYPRDDLTPLISCSAEQLVGQDLLEQGDGAEEVLKLRRYLFRENIRDVHNSAHQFACTATLHQLLVRASEVRWSISSSDLGEVPIEHYQHDVFISYHARDAWEVFECLFTTFEGLGANVFNPSKDLQRTAVSSAEMIKHVKGSRCFLQVLTPHYPLSQWCRAELLAAAEAGIPTYVVYAGKKHTQAQLQRVINMTPKRGKDMAAIQQAQATIRRAVQEHGLSDVYNPDFAADTAHTLEAIAYAELPRLTRRRHLRWATYVALLLLLVACCLGARVGLAWRGMLHYCEKGELGPLQQELEQWALLGNATAPLKQCAARLRAEKARVLAEDNFERFAKNGEYWKVKDIVSTLHRHFEDERIVYSGILAIKDLEFCSAAAQDIVAKAIREKRWDASILLCSFEALLPCARDRWGSSRLRDPCEVLCEVTTAANFHAADGRVQAAAAHLLHRIADSTSEVDVDSNSSAGGMWASAKTFIAGNATSGASRLARCACIPDGVAAVRTAMASSADRSLHVQGCEALAELAPLAAEPALLTGAAAQVVSSLVRFMGDKDEGVADAALEALRELSEASRAVRVWLARNATAVGAALAILAEDSPTNAKLRAPSAELLATLVPVLPDSQPSGRPATSICRAAVLAATRSLSMGAGAIPTLNSTLLLIEHLSASAAYQRALVDGDVTAVLYAIMTTYSKVLSVVQRIVFILSELASAGDNRTWTRMAMTNVSKAVSDVLRLPFPNTATRQHAVTFLGYLSQVPSVGHDMAADAVEACIRSLELQGQPTADNATRNLFNKLAEDPDNRRVLVMHGAAQHCLQEIQDCNGFPTGEGCELEVERWALPLLSRLAESPDAAKAMAAQLSQNGSSTVLERYMMRSSGSLQAQIHLFRLLNALLEALKEVPNHGKSVIHCVAFWRPACNAAAAHAGNVEVQHGLITLARHFVEQLPSRVLPGVEDINSGGLCVSNMLPTITQAMGRFAEDEELQINAVAFMWEITARAPWGVQLLIRTMVGPLIESLRLHAGNETLRHTVLRTLSGSAGERSWTRINMSRAVHVLAEVALRMSEEKDTETWQAIAIMRAVAASSPDAAAFLSWDPARNASSLTPVLRSVVEIMTSGMRDHLTQSEAFRLFASLSAWRPWGEAVVAAGAIPTALPAAQQYPCDRQISPMLVKLARNLALFGLCNATFVSAVLLRHIEEGCDSALPNQTSLAVSALLRVTESHTMRDALILDGFVTALAHALERNQRNLERPQLGQGMNALALFHMMRNLARAEAHRKELVMQGFIQVALLGIRFCDALAAELRVELALSLVQSLTDLAHESDAAELLVDRGVVVLLRELHAGACLAAPNITDIQAATTSPDGQQLLQEQPGGQDADADTLPILRLQIASLTLQLLAQLAADPADRLRMVQDGALDLAANLSSTHADSLDSLRAAVDVLHALAPEAPAAACGGGGPSVSANATSSRLGVLRRARSAAVFGTCSDPGRLAGAALQALAAGPCGGGGGASTAAPSGERPVVAALLAGGSVHVLPRGDRPGALSR